MINFLPPQEKSYLAGEKNRKLLIIVGILILIFVLSLSLILLAIKIYLDGRVEAQRIIMDAKKVTPEIVQAQGLLKKIQAVNVDLDKLDSFYSGQIHLIDVFAKVHSLLPSGIYLNNLTYRRGNLSITLNGYSPSRQLLLNFKDNLEKEETLQDVVFTPDEIWGKSKDIEFNTAFKVVLDNDQQDE